MKSIVGQLPLRIWYDKVASIMSALGVLLPYAVEIHCAMASFVGAKKVKFFES